MSVRDCDNKKACDFFSPPAGRDTILLNQSRQRKREKNRKGQQECTQKKGSKKTRTIGTKDGTKFHKRTEGLQGKRKRENPSIYLFIYFLPSFLIPTFTFAAASSHCTLPPLSSSLSPQQVTTLSRSHEKFEMCSHQPSGLCRRHEGLLLHADTRTSPPPSYRSLALGFIPFIQPDAQPAVEDAA
mmetsp:Transcript_53095/g.103899  ORF Transcript_53095/g.103899 Transcript_53095/m.103899 type:complete len:185 (-) Transcript_53095:648-1202(-)